MFVLLAQMLIDPNRYRSKKYFPIRPTNHFTKHTNWALNERATILCVQILLIDVLGVFNHVLRSHVPLWAFV